MSGRSDESSAERLIARLVLAAERDYLTAALAFLREAAARLGLSAADIAALAQATEEVSPQRHRSRLRARRIRELRPRAHAEGPASSCSPWRTGAGRSDWSR